jgi:Inner membrane protein YgaP-like, transmembrane domain
MEFARFMSSMYGRLLRIVAGIVLVVVGLLAVQGIGGIILAIVGLVPLVAGLFNFCVFAPLFGGPFWSKDLQPKPVPAKISPPNQIK